MWIIGICAACVKQVSSTQASVRPGGPPMPAQVSKPPVTSTPVVTGDPLRSYADTDVSPLSGLWNASLFLSCCLWSVLIFLSVLSHHHTWLLFCKKIYGHMVVFFVIICCFEKILLTCPTLSVRHMSNNCLKNEHLLRKLCINLCKASGKSSLSWSNELFLIFLMLDL